MEGRIKSIVADVLDIEEEILTPDFGPESAAEWDSLNNLKMVTALEAEFNVQFSMADIMEMTTFAAILSVIKKYVD